MFRILAAVDQDTDRARAQAEFIASLPAATGEVEVVLMHIFQENPEGAGVTQIDAVRRMAEKLDEYGIAYDMHESSGEPAEQVVKAADELDVDMICLSGRQRSPTGKVVFGSVTQDVILSTTRPVLTVSPDT